MKKYIALGFFVLLVATATFADNKLIFQLKDSRGDDHGDGTLILPSDGELQFGDFDIVSLTAKAEEGGTLFEAEFANTIDVPDSRAIDAGGRTLNSVARLGFYTFNIDIYIDMDRKPGSGLTTTLPGRNALIDPEFAWERVICLTPRPSETRNVLKRQLTKILEEKLESRKGRVDPEDTSGISADASTDLQGTYFFPERVRVTGRKVSFFVPSSFLGGPAKADWGYVILVTVATVEDRLSFGNFGGAIAGETLMNLPVAEGSWNDRLGSTRKESKNLPPIIDMFVPEGKKQEDVLRSFNDTTGQPVTLPAVMPAGGQVPHAVISAAQQAPPAVAASKPDLSSRIAPDIPQRLKQFARTEIDYNRTLLDENDKRVVAKLLEASHYIEDIYWIQAAEENPKTRAQLVKDAATSPEIAKALEYFDLMKGRWDRLKENEPFIAPFGEAGKKPLGAGFYPVDMTKEEFEQHIKQHPEDKDNFQGLFTVIQRKEGSLVAIPYSEYYKDALTRAAKELKDAAEITEHPTLRDYLNKRADAFLSNDYYQSDIAWMDLDSPIDPVIGPYEVYEDELFNYKASFESFITVVDTTETDKLKMYLQHIPDMEKNLPIPDIHKNPNRGGDNSLRVVQEIFTAGDARRGVQTSAFNLPNDERVRNDKGFKNVIIKNVMEAKFKQSGEPIARRVLDPSVASMLSFDAYFNHTTFHELSHGLGPGFIIGPDGKKVETRLMLKDAYSTIEECKADVLGIWNLQYGMDEKWFTAFDAKALNVTNVGLMFRGMRFGIGEAHGRGTAIQWNWYREKGAIVPTKDNRFTVDFPKMREAVRSLANELLMIEASGDYERGKRLLDAYGKVTPEIEKITALLKDIPVDIAPVFTAAGEK